MDKELKNLFEDRNLWIDTLYQHLLRYKFDGNFLCTLKYALTYLIVMFTHLITLECIMILIINMITQGSFHPRMITQCSFCTCIINITEEQRATTPASSGDTGEYNWNKTLNVISLCAYIHDGIRLKKLRDLEFERAITLLLINCLYHTHPLKRLLSACQTR